MIKRVGRAGEIPKQWEGAITNAHYSMKEIVDCDYCKAIALGTHAGKVFLQVVASRLSSRFEAQGLLRGKIAAAENHIFILYTREMMVVLRLQDVGRKG